MPFSKPHPAPLLQALGQLGLRDRPDRSIYVGDAPDDMRMARTVGARGVGIESILGERSELEAAGAAEIAPSVTSWVEAFLSMTSDR